ncbi:MAG TPA: HNH endonuclease [Bryobacteraceae bacterium]|nr:HNH endonuclease [Bryobacteraceae bacterium]
MQTVLGRLGLMPLAKPLTPDEGRHVLERDGYRCRYCGLDGSSSFENSLVMSVDFVLPRARQGKKDQNNLVAACRPCNLIKGKKVFANFEDARQYVLGRRSELQKEWEKRVARLQTRAAAATQAGQLSRSVI